MVLKRNILKLKSATLVEVIVASVISAVSFAVGLMIYLNILHANRANLKTQIDLFIDQDIYYTNEERKYKSETSVLENVEIQKNISFYNQTDDVMLLNYQAINTKGKIILEKNVLSYLEK